MPSPRCPTFDERVTSTAATPRLGTLRSRPTSNTVVSVESMCWFRRQRVLDSRPLAASHDESTRRLPLPVSACVPPCFFLVLLVALAAACSESSPVEQARAECEARERHTELLLLAPMLYVCYEITVEDDGWRLCSLSAPALQVRTDEAEVPAPWPCGNTKSRYSVEDTELEAELLWPPSVVAPKGCDSALAWLESYLSSVSHAAAAEQVVLAPDSATADDLAAAYARLGRLLEQLSPRAEAVRGSCIEDLGVDAIAVTTGIHEVERELNAEYKTFVKACIAHGGVDCGVLAPTAKELCEGMSSEFVYLLDQETLDLFSLDGWPHSARAIGCTLRERSESGETSGARLVDRLAAGHSANIQYLA